MSSPVPNPPPPPPPTTNNLDPHFRQELLRKHRKLAQVLGEGVGGALWPSDDPHAQFDVAPPVPPKGISGMIGSKHKPSKSGDLESGGNGNEQILLIGPPKRRHSTPGSADMEFDFRVGSGMGLGRGQTNVMNIGSGNFAAGAGGDGSGSSGAATTVAPSRSSNETLKEGSKRAESPMSFMEFDEDDHEHDDPSHHNTKDDTDRASILTTTTTTTTSAEVQAELERKKMRDKLAKLHRFLGSRVPVELALGAEYVLDDSDLPPERATGDIYGYGSWNAGKGWKLRRRSSSSAYEGRRSGRRSVGPGGVIGGLDVDEVDERTRTSLDDRQRALVVKRANKMEQVRRVFFPLLSIIVC